MASCYARVVRRLKITTHGIKGPSTRTSTRDYQASVRGRHGHVELGVFPQFLVVVSPPWPRQMYASKAGVNEMLNIVQKVHKALVNLTFIILANKKARR
jgi:hypothetical protein